MTFTRPHFSPEERDAYLKKDMRLVSCMSEIWVQFFKDKLSYSNPRLACILIAIYLP